jgi:hypothetical protein
MMGVNTCFHIAMFAALVNVTSSRQPHFYPSEAFVLLLFCVCGTCSTFLMSRRFFHPEVAHTALFWRMCASTLGGLVRVGLSLAISVYGIWFAFHGLDTMAERPPCSSTVFFFAPVSIYGWFRTVLRIMSVCGTLATGVIFFISLLRISQDSRDWLKNWMQAEQDVEEGTTGDMGFPSLQEIFIALVMFATFAVAVELTLVWSHVKGVYSVGSTGQLFPLVIGVAGLLRLAYILSRNFLRGDIRNGNQ